LLLLPRLGLALLPRGEVGGKQPDPGLKLSDLGVLLGKLGLCLLRLAPCLGGFST
jgi:hypothetical protein